MEEQVPKKRRLIWLKVLLAVILLLIGLMFALSTSPVQTLIAQFFSGVLSDKLGTNVEVDKVKIRFFNKVVVDGFLMEDLSGDTLIYSDRLDADIGRLSIRYKYADINNIHFHNPIVGISTDSLNQPSYKFLEVLSSADSTQDNNWNFIVGALILDNGRLSYNPHGSSEGFQYSNIDVGISDILISEDSTLLRLDSLSLNDINGFRVNNLSGNLLVKFPIIQMKDFSLSSDLADISSNNMLVDLSKMNESGNMDDLILDCSINRSYIDFRNLGLSIHKQIPSNLQVSLSGKVKGKLKSLSGDNITLSTGRKTSINCNFKIQKTIDNNNAHLNFLISKSQIDLHDIDGLVIPFSNSTTKIPPPLLDGGIYKMSGELSGYINNFSAHATIESQFGNISTNLQVLPGDRKTVLFNGSVNTYKLDINNMLNNKLIDKLSFRGDVNGIYDYDNNKISTDVNGTIDSFYLDGYTFSKISLIGNIDKDKYEGSIDIDDPNLSLSLNGIIDRNKTDPNLDFKLNVEYAKLDELSFVPESMLKSTAFELDAKIKGSDMLNYLGEINIDNGYLSSDNNTLIINDIQIKRTKGVLDNFVFSSPFVDMFMNGTFRFRDMATVFKTLVAQHLPNSILNEKENRDEVVDMNFVMEVHFKKLDDITQFITPDLHISDQFSLSSSLNSYDKVFNINTTIPELAYGTTYINNLAVNGQAGSNNLNAIISASNISLNNKYKISDLSFNTKARDNKIDYLLKWFNDKDNQGNISGHTQLLTGNDSTYTKSITTIPTSEVLMNGKTWELSLQNVEKDSASTYINNLIFTNTENNHSIHCNGIISDKDDEKIDIDINNIEVKTVFDILRIDAPLDAEVNGTLSVWSILNKPKVSSHIQAEDIEFKSHKIGNLNFENTWDFKTKNISADVKLSNNNKPIVNCDALYNIKTDSLSFDSKIDGFPLELLELVMSKVFSNTSGKAYGGFKISGKIPDIEYTGALLGDSARFTVAATGASYHFTDTVFMNGNKIVFKDITAYDNYGNSANVDGYISHSNFGNMLYNIDVNTSRICALNSTPKQNEIFYGDAFAEGRIKISGTSNNILISGNATTGKGTKLNMGLFHKGLEETHSFIRFVERNETKDDNNSIKDKLNYISETTGVGFSLNITATPDASFKIFYFNSLDDEMEAKGNGNLKIELNKYGDYTMAGTFIATEGTYRFSLKDLLTKTFKIKPGSTLRWSGAPQDADVNISAIYQIKTSLTDLSGGEISTVTRPMVDCYIIITGLLTSPNINFDIKFPTVDAGTASILQQYLSTPDELNRQALSLLLLGRFYNNNSNSGAGTDFVNNTASELITSSLSSLLSNINKNVNIGVIYRPNDGAIQDEFEVSMSTALLNDYITISGNVGNTNNAYYLSNTNNNIVGEFDVSVKLTKDGNWLLKAYNHANNNFYDAAPYTQGVSLTFKHDFDLLIKRYNKKYKKNKGKGKKDDSDKSQ